MQLLPRAGAVAPWLFDPAGRGRLTTGIVSIAASAKRFRSNALRYPTYLTDDVKGVGIKGEIVLLKAGTARNKVRHMKLGHMLPTSYFRFDSFRRVYEDIGIPSGLAQMYYDGKLIPRVVGEMSTERLTPKVIAERHSAADLLQIRLRFAEELQSKHQHIKLEMLPARPESPNFVLPPVERLLSGNFEGIDTTIVGIESTFTAKDFVDKLQERGVANCHICLPSGIGVRFRCPQTGKLEKEITKSGVYEAFIRTQMVPRFSVKLEVCIAEKSPEKDCAAIGAGELSQTSPGDLSMADIENKKLYNLVPGLDSSKPPVPSPNGAKLLARYRLQRKRDWYTNAR